MTTTDVESGAFDGDVFLSFGGPQGQSDEVQLTTDAPTAAPFAANATSTFTVQGGDVGPIASLAVRPVSQPVTGPWRHARYRVGDHFWKFGCPNAPLCCLNPLAGTAWLVAQPSLLPVS